MTFSTETGTTNHSVCFPVLINNTWLVDVTVQHWGDHHSNVMFALATLVLLV